MIYCSDLNIIIISGGRKDFKKQNSQSDMFVLHLDKLFWTEVTYCSTKGVARFGAAFGKLGSQLVIFGG